MRVIAGTAKSIKLDTISGDKTRPTTDRTRKPYNMINMMSQTVFLDLNEWCNRN